MRELFSMLSTLVACAVGGFAFFTTTTQVGNALLTSLKPDRRLFAATCITALINASLLSPLSLYAGWLFMNSPSGLNLECASGVQSLITTPSNLYGVVAVGLTCGYFLADCVGLRVLLILYPEQMKKDLGSPTQHMIIMWVHHGISLIVWPYSALRGSAFFFVLYYSVTEVTNIGQNSYLLLREFKSPLEKHAAAAWMLSFFIVRVLPVPLLLYIYAEMLWLQNCGLPTLDLWIGRLTVPIPVGLNLMWFSMMIQKAQRMMSTAKQ